MALHYFSLGGDEQSAQRLFTKSKLPVAFPSMPVILPHRLRRKLRATRSKIRSRQTPTSSLAALNTSWKPSDTLRDLRSHRWSFHDAQYLFLAILCIFSLSMIQVPGPLVKTMVASAILTALVIPITRQFFLPALPIFTWLFLFYSCQFIPSEYRPRIWVRVLPALENILYGANLSNILSAHKNTLFDVLAWLPYGITHFGAPFVVSIALFIFGPPGIVPVFARSFGYMNIAGVLIQIFFPCSPPWYENKYGLAPANYSMPGSPAGLAAIDKLFGIDLYTSSFTASPVVFGAFPSLHSGSMTIEVLFMSWAFPRVRPLWAAYFCWLWWATMYLSHHYAVDLVAGSLISVIAWMIAKSKYVPRMQPGKMFRWDYDYVEKGEPTEAWEYGFTELDEFDPAFRTSDEWTIGSSSSVSSSREPSSDIRSPVSGDEHWDGDTLASSDDEPTKA